MIYFAGPRCDDFYIRQRTEHLRFDRDSRTEQGDPTKPAPLYHRGDGIEKANQGQGRDGRQFLGADLRRKSWDRGNLRPSGSELAQQSGKIARQLRSLTGGRVGQDAAHIGVHHQDAGRQTESKVSVD